LGQQQLLLIVLGVIIVGVAVVVGINLFNAHARIAAMWLGWSKFRYKFWEFINGK
jgi:hypothetical protein